MPNKFVLHYDDTVPQDEVEQMRTSMMLASLEHPGCTFEMLKGTMGGDGYHRDSFRYGINRLYPQLSSSAGSFGGGDMERHVVVSRDELKTMGGLSLRSPSGNTQVVNMNISSLNGLSPLEKRFEIDDIIRGEARKMYGEPSMRDYLSGEEAIAAWDEVQRILAAEAGDPEEEMEQLGELFQQIKGKSTKRQPKLYFVSETQKPAQQVPKQNPKRGNDTKKSKTHGSPKKTKQTGKRTLGTMTIGKVSKLK